MHALLTLRVYLAFFMFTYYDFSLWLEKLAERLYYCFLGGIAPVTIALGYHILPLQGNY